ncbi:uncharacterized protein LOC135482191 [Liolophura sinensis]|uniref:uncharacterized protein LOC135482191 n=1 Tax=Liolophura sinensis TaxID=3198878 RepID=UPI003157FD59
MMAPPENFKLKAFLVKLSKEMTQEDLEYMKDMFKGNGGIGRGVLESLTLPVHFFDRLQTAGFLSMNNIVVLQALVWHTGRKDLYQQTVSFAEQVENVVYTCDPTPVAENGFKYTRFHLKCDLNKEKIEELRAVVARWMSVPTHLVCVAGVQPSESWIITLMVPDIDTLDLSEVIRRHRDWLVHKDIDRFEIDDKVINLTEGTTDSVENCNELLIRENTRLRKMNADLEDVKENLWTHIRIQENVIAKLKSSVEKLSTSVVEKRSDYGPYYFGLFLWTLCYLHLFKKTFVDGTSLGLRLKNGAVTAVDRLTSKFRECMEAIRKKDYDAELIDGLLDSFRRLVRVEQLEEIRLSAFLVQHQHMEVFVQNLVLEQENRRLTLELIRQIMESGESGKTPESGTPGPPINVEAHTNVVIRIRNDFLSALAEISRQMMPKDKDRILKAVGQELNIDRAEFAYLMKTDQRFLELLVIKKIQDLTMKSDQFHKKPEIYILQLLKKANRQDLSKQLTESLTEARIEGLNIPMPFFKGPWSQGGVGELHPYGAGQMPFSL